MKKIWLILSVLLITVSFAGVDQAQAYSMTTGDSSKIKSEKIVITFSYKDASTAVSSYKYLNGKMSKTHKCISMFDTKKFRLKVFNAKKIEIHGKYWWQIGTNSYLKDKRIKVVHY